MHANYADLMTKVNETADWNGEIEQAFHDVLKDFKANSAW